MDFLGKMKEKLSSWLILNVSLSRKASMLLFSMTDKSHGSYAITPVTLKSFSETELRASQPNQSKCKTDRGALTVL